MLFRLLSDSRLIVLIAEREERYNSNRDPEQSGRFVIESPAILLDQ